MNRFRFALTILLAVASAAQAQTGSVNTNGTGTSGVYVETTSSSFPDVGVEVIDSFKVFNSSNQQLLRVYPTGKIVAGIGSPTTGDNERLHVFDDADRNSLVVMENPNTGLSVASGFRAKADVAFGSFHAHSSTRTLQRFGQTLGGWMEVLHVAGNGLIVGTTGAVPVILGTNNVNRINIGSDGNVGIGAVSTGAKLHVNGDISATGNIAAKYQDVAEWVPSREDLSAGTVVVLDASIGNAVMASSSAYDTTVAGVVSAQPGIILGEAGSAREQIATTGRVKVKVDATAAPIRVGDLLVTSSRPGYAMKSIPVDVSGIAMHRPGTILGKALEALPSGEGEILVLLSLQ